MSWKSFLHKITPFHKGQIAQGTPGAEYAPYNYNPLIDNIIKGKNLAGTTFDPNGDPAVLQSLGEAFGRMGQNQERAALTAADTDASNDPYAHAFARLKARQGIASNMANAFGSYRLQQAQGVQALRNALLGQQAGVGSSAYLAGLQGKIQDASQMPFWQQYLLAGAGAAGGAAGGAVGKG